MKTIKKVIFWMFIGLKAATTLVLWVAFLLGDTESILYVAFGITMIYAFTWIYKQEFE